MDFHFVVQGIWGDRVCEEDGDDDQDKAIAKAKEMAASPLFEGDCVRVITRDGELVWISNG